MNKWLYGLLLTCTSCLIAIVLILGAGLVSKPDKYPKKLATALPPTGAVTYNVQITDPTAVAAATVDDAGNLHVTGSISGGTITAVATPYTTHAYQGSNGAVIKDAGGTLYSFHCNSRGSGVDYVFTSNSASAIAVDAGSYLAPFLLPPFPGEIIVGSDLLGGGAAFSNGVGFGISTVATGYTADPTAANFDCNWNVQ